MTTINLTKIDLATLSSKDLRNLARDCSVKNWWNMKKEDLLNALSAVKDSQKPKATKKDKKTKEKKAADLGGNVVTIQDLASEYNMDQKIARRILRSAGTSRMNGERRWAWDKKDKALADAIKILKSYTPRKKVA